MSPLFQRIPQSDKTDARRKGASERAPRHSSGWVKILARLKEAPGLRVLDIGPTSPANINFLTELGHSVYMADLVEEAVKPEWTLPPLEDGALRYDIDAFLARHMDFGDRKFDIVLLWDAIDYIPVPVADAVLRRLVEVTSESAQTLAFFHSRNTGPETAFCRYHIADGPTIFTQESTPHPVLRTCQNRQIETMLQDLGSCRFYLAKDNTREVVVTRG